MQNEDFPFAVLTDYPTASDLPMIKIECKDVIQHPTPYVRINNYYGIKTDDWVVDDSFVVLIETGEVVGCSIHPPKILRQVLAYVRQNKTLLMMAWEGLIEGRDVNNIALCGVEWWIDHNIEVKNYSKIHARKVKKFYDTFN